MEFLGYSQTFIGVLTSLVVLCILDSGNFIHGILKKVGDRIDAEIKSLDKNLNIKSKIEVQSNYKLFQLFIKSPTDIELQMMALELDMHLNASFNKFKFQFTPQLIKPASSLINAIKESKEQLIAPLYVLLYCVVVFLCDELVYAELLEKDFVVTFLTIFTSFSFVFWGILWYAFYRDIKIIPEENREIKKSTRIEEWICKNTTWANTIPVFLICCIISIIPFLMQLSGNIALFCFLIGMILNLLIIAIITISRVRSHNHFGHYLYIFSLKHFGGIFFLSSLFTIIFFVNGFCCDEIKDLYFTYTSLVYIKFAIIFFIILNGLFLPFLMPYWGFNRVLKIVQKEVHNMEEDFEKMVTRINKTIEDFCQKIRVNGNVQ